MDQVHRNVLRDLGHQFDPLSLIASKETWDRLATAARESTARWTFHNQALELLRDWLKRNRRKSKGWRRHIRRVKAGR